MVDGERRCPSCGRGFGLDVLFCPTDGVPLTQRASILPASGGSDPYVGLKLLGQIEIKKLAGVGSMARVYRAFQHGVERDVAVKILHRELSSNPEIVERFHREARVAGKVAHPNVVQVLLTAQLPQDHPQVGGELVMVMEYLDGMSLLSALRASGGALALPRALHVALQICDAVGDAHALGVVHRDLKPENVMLVRRGDDPDFVKVLDFGLARLSVRDASYATRAGAIFGSPRYISPEGAQGLPVGPSADVYAIATLLYQCLAGRTPFEAESPVGFLLAHANEPAPRVSSHERASYVPAPLVDLLDQALAKRPEDRPADARQLGRALLEAARRSGLMGEALLLGSSFGGAASFASLSRTHEMPVVVARPELGNPLSTGTMAGPDDVAEAIAPKPRVRPPTLPPTPSPVPIDGPAKPLTMPPELLEPDGAELLARVSASGIAPTLFDEPLPSPSALRDQEVPAPVAARASGPSEPGEGGPRVSGPPGLLSSTSSPEIATASLLPVSSTSLPTVPPMSPPASPSLVGLSSSESIPAPVPSPRWRSPWATVAIVAACFGGGAGLAMLGAKRLGVVASPVVASPADSLLAEAAEASKRAQWDEPAGKSVRDLLSRGRTEFPADPRFAEAQDRASLTLTMSAVKERSANNHAEAERLARLAMQFDENNTVASGIVQEIEALRAAPPATNSAPVSRANGRPAGRPGAAAPAAPATPSTAKTAVPDDKGAKGGKGSPGDKTPGNWL